MGQSASRSASKGLNPSRVLIQAYLLGLPLWWGLGIDFTLPALLGLCLIVCSPGTFRSFRPSDYLLMAIILCLGLSAYVNGLLIAGEPTRFLAALYNLSIWIGGLVLIRAVRELLRQGADADRVLRAGFAAFVPLLAVAWGSFALAYALDDFHLEIPSLFGLTFGRFVPDSAPLIQESTRLVFTQADWGLPGVPMPRVAVYGPYPTATAATTAVVGTLALLHLHRRGRTVLLVAAELLILATIATTLTRSTLGGWVMGVIAANLIFGSAWRRVFACAALAGTLLVVSYADDSDQALEYRSYSSESRFENYMRAVDQTLGQNPVLGLGIKPREAENHIAVGSHSTFVSSFTKGGALALSLTTAYLVIIPAMRWLSLASRSAAPVGSRAELRILLNLQVSIWVWLCFEDIDAPASAALLIFLSSAFIERALGVKNADAWQRLGRQPLRSPSSNTQQGHADAVA